MILKIHTFPHIFYASIGTDQHGTAQHADILFVIPLLFTPKTKAIEDSMINVRQQGEIQPMLFGKRLVRGKIIGAEAVDGDIQGAKLRNSITEFRCFDGSAIGVILGVNKDYITLPQ